jgi:WD40 repeat protein/beta-lactamase regulating signal transducer with metallopeptidase domain
LIAAFWLAGACLFAAFALRSARRANGIRRRAAPLQDARFQRTANAAAKAVGLRRCPAVLTSSEVDAPVVIGFRFPMIVFPAWGTGTISERELRDICIHEFAHIRRGDQWTLLVQAAARSLFWPVVTIHWLNRELGRAREEVCDNFVLAQQDAIAYGDLLLRLAHRALGTRPIPGTMGILNWKGELEERFARILDPQASRATGISAAARLLFVATFLVAGAGLCGTRFVAGQAPGKPGGGTEASAPQPSQKSDEDAISSRSRNALPADGDDARNASTTLPPRALLQLGTDDLRTRDFITDTAFSPDGKLIATVAANGDFPRVWLFDVRTGREAKRIIVRDLPRGWIQSVAFSPDQSRLVWGEIGGLVALWDLKNDRLLFREKVHGAGVKAVQFSPDGKLIGSAGDDGMIHLRNAANPLETVQSFAPGRAPAIGVSIGDAAGGSGAGSIAFTPDSTRLVVGTAANATISIWRIRDGQLLRRIENAHGNSKSSVNPALNCVAVMPDGRRTLSAGQRTVPRSETTLEYGSKTVTMSEVRVWDIETGERLKDLHGEQDHGFGYAALSGDGKRVAVADFALLRILDAGTGEAEHTISLPGSWGQRPEFSPDGTLVAMPIHNAIGLFDVQTGKRLHHDEQSPVDGVRSAGWSPAGDRIVTGHGDGEVRVWDAQSGKLIWHQILAPLISRSGWNACPYFVSFSADGRRVIAAGRRDDPVEYRDGIIAVYHAGTGLLVREDFSKEIRWGGLSPDGGIGVFATSQGSIGDTHLIGIELQTGKKLYVTPPEDERRGFWPMEAMQFRPNTPALLVAAKNGDVMEFDGLTGKEQRRFAADFRTPEQVQARKPRDYQMWTGAFSADGRTLISSSAEFVYVWDVETGKLRRIIRHPHDHGCNVTVSPDNRTFATSDLQYAGDYGQDTIRLYDLETGEQIMALEPDDNRAPVMAFSPDGNRLFTGSHRGSAIVWDVRR